MTGRPDKLADALLKISGKMNRMPTNELQKVQKMKVKHKCTADVNFY